MNRWSSIDRWLLNGRLMQDYVPFMLIAIQWPQEAPSQFAHINQPVHKTSLAHALLVS